MENNSRPIIKFGVGNGIHSQLMSFLDAMVVASLYKEHYDVLLPIMWGDSWVDGENRSQPMRFEEIYDADYFTTYMSNYIGLVYRKQPNY